MQSAELRELTSSEELTLEQEYEMQREPIPVHLSLNHQIVVLMVYFGGKYEVGREDADSAWQTLSSLSLLMILVHLARAYVHRSRASAGAAVERLRTHKRG